ncbi:MAG: aldo/keto reductase, partial [Bacteroidales bacterium]|nr:aldo/keto reductase [Bacteroidales bacterium]
REDRFPDLAKAFSDEGAMGALREAKQKGIIRFIGASGHVYPSRLHYAIDSGEIDVMMVAVNYIIQHNYDFEHKIWLRALTKDIGMVAMKVLGGAEVTDRSHRIPAEDYEMAIRYAITLQGLSSAVVGVKNLEEYNLLINTFLKAKPLTEDEYLSLSKRGLEILENEERWRTMHGLPLT